MNNSARLFLVIGAINSMLAVMLGAFGSHVLKNKLTEDMLVIFQIGTDYHFYHALALVVVGLAAQHLRDPLINISAWLFLAGILIFSGSLYSLSLSGIRSIGAITPIGGVLFIVAWALFAVAVVRNRK